MDEVVDTTSDGSRHTACLAAQVADAKQASDVVVFSVGEVLGVVEYFVVASASNRRLVRAVVDEVEEHLKVELSRSPIRVEGGREQEWVLMDYGDVVVHVFFAETREFYDIERLYRDAPRIDWEHDVES